MFYQFVGRVVGNGVDLLVWVCVGYVDLLVAVSTLCPEIMDFGETRFRIVILIYTDDVRA